MWYVVVGVVCVAFGFIAGFFVGKNNAPWLPAKLEYLEKELKDIKSKL